MLNNVNGGNVALELLLQQQLLLQFEERAQEREEPEQIVHGVLWLSEPKADPSYASPKANEWTCTRCRSHQCIRTNPGDQQDATFCCAVCGYTFHGASATRLPGAVSRSSWHRSVRLNRGLHTSIRTPRKSSGGTDHNSTGLGRLRAGSSRLSIHPEPTRSSGGPEFSSRPWDSKREDPARAVEASHGHERESTDSRREAALIAEGCNLALLRPRAS